VRKSPAQGLVWAACERVDLPRRGPQARHRTCSPLNWSSHLPSVTLPRL